MQLVKGTILADVSDMYYADTILIELREHLAVWLGQPDCTKEQAVQMCNWAFAHAAFQQRPAAESVHAWRDMVIAAGMIPTGCEFHTTPNGVWMVR